MHGLLNACRTDGQLSSMIEVTRIIRCDLPVCHMHAQDCHCMQEALLRGSVSDEDVDEISEKADDAEEVSQEDEDEVEGGEVEDSPSAASLDQHASENEDEQEASEGLADEDAAEAGRDTDSQPGTEQDDSADEQEAEEEEDGVATEPVLDSKVHGETLASRSEEQTEPEHEQRPESRAAKRHKKRKVQSEDPDSLQSLKRQLTEAKRQASTAAQPEHQDTVTNADSAAAAPPQVCCSPYHLSVFMHSRTLLLTHNVCTWSLWRSVWTHV